MSVANSTTANPSDRDVSLDIARGIAMILVVLGHALVGAVNAGGDTHLARWLIVIIYTTHMALFFELSALLSQGLRKRPWPEFSRMMAVRIVWPYLLWSFVLLSAHYVMSNYTNVEVKTYEPWTILWKAPAVMWFLYVLFVAMVLLRLFAPVSAHVTLAIGGGLMVGAYVIPGVPENARWVGLFLITAMIGQQVLPTLMRPVWVLVAGLVMGVAAWLAWQQTIAPLEGYPASDLRYVPALIAGPVLLLALSRVLAGGALQGGLALVGRNTMPIFVTHILITAGSRIALRMLGFDNWTVIVCVATVLGVVLPLIAVTLTNRLKLSHWLGWR